MLTFFKEIFTWWNGQTLGTRLQTIFFGKLVGEDELGNKYYQNKKGKRWVIYNGEVEASKIPNDWYSWMHHTNNKIENSHNLKKYKWQKNHLPNQTGTTNAYNPKNNKNATEKKYKIAYHSACSMQHGQKVHQQPKDLISKTGNEVLEIPEGHLCCGSAGTYNILHQKMAKSLLKNKVKYLNLSFFEILLFSDCLFFE